MELIYKGIASFVHRVFSMGVLQTKWIIKAIQNSSSILTHLMHVILMFIKQNTQ
jgi:hypothetical protein